MSITDLLPTYPPVALDPVKLITEVFASLPESKRKTIKPENLRSLAIDAWYWRRDNWICDVGEEVQATMPTISEKAEPILDALYQVNEEYASSIELGDADLDGYTLGFALAVLRWHELDQTGQIPDFDWSDAQVQAWVDNRSVEVPDANGQFRLF